MKAFVTGANSLVGSHIVRALLEKKHQVCALVRENSDTRCLENLDIETIYGDVLQPGSFEDALHKCTVVFHAAAKFTYSPFDNSDLNNLVQKGTENIITCAKEKGVKRIVLTSSSVTIGAARDPQTLDETSEKTDGNSGKYVESKIHQEEIAMKKASSLGVDLILACPTICVGENDYRLAESNALFINYLKDPFKSTWPGGCNIVSAMDVGRGHLILAEKGESGEKYVLGSENLYWATIHSIISELCGIDGPRTIASHTTSYLAGITQEISSWITGKRPFVTREQAKMVGMFYWYSSRKAMALGYQPMHSREALTRAISWLVTSDHVTREQRATLTLSDDIYAVRN
ncbi:MAG: NAD-dependent epimerase/dehydratase family protein [Nitrospinota bacterium]